LIDRVDDFNMRHFEGFITSKPPRLPQAGTNHTGRDCSPADVGLGKTIVAGLIASELLLRRRVQEIVVACPPSMLLQWRDELENRFGLTFEIFDRE